jgi:hypothetical protein
MAPQNVNCNGSNKVFKYSNIYKVSKSRMIWPVHATYLEEMKYAYKIMVRKCQEKTV